MNARGNEREKVKNNATEKKLEEKQEENGNTENEKEGE